MESSAAVAQLAEQQTSPARLGDSICVVPARGKGRRTHCQVVGSNPTCGSIAIKMCTTCGRELELIEFNRDRSRPDGRNGQCKTCATEYQRAYHRSNPQRRTGYRAKQMRDRNNVARELWPVIRCLFAAAIATHGRLHLSRGRLRELERQGFI